MTSQDYYYDSHAHYSVHEKVLKDEVRNKSFRNAIFHNKHLFRGKIVLEVGTGTGILSMFAARSGAERVIAIESSNITEYTAKIFAANELDHIITLIQGKIEEVKLPDDIEKVDIIICDWMGSCLFYKSNINSVLFARDKWLDKQHGIMFPDRSSLFVVGLQDCKIKDKKFDWWDNVYGFDMSAIRKFALSEPLVGFVDQTQLVTTACCIKEIDLYNVKKEDLMFSSQFHLKVHSNDYVSAILTYFVVDFTKCSPRVSFSTSPEFDCTHWKVNIL